MTLALAVIIMEMSNDVRILLPAMTAIMLAKWVADAASHSLYHGLLEVKCVPFLPREPVADMSLDLLEVRHVMAAPVVTLPERLRLGDVRDVLRLTRHNGFPVVRPLMPMTPLVGGGSGSGVGLGGTLGAGHHPQMDMGKQLDFNHELITVGLANAASGLSGGFTGSYIFSTTVFTYRTGARRLKITTPLCTRKGRTRRSKITRYE